MAALVKVIISYNPVDPSEQDKPRMVEPEVAFALVTEGRARWPDGATPGANPAGDVPEPVTWSAEPAQRIG